MNPNYYGAGSFIIKTHTKELRGLDVA